MNRREFLAFISGYFLLPKLSLMEPERYTWNVSYADEIRGLRATCIMLFDDSLRDYYTTDDLHSYMQKIIAP